MCVLITGVAGLIGSHIAERAVAAGQIVRGVDVPGADTSFLRSLGIELVEGDLVDPQVARRAVQGCEVVYNAVRRTGDYGTFDLYHRPNVLTTESVLAAAIGAGVRRIVHASSYMVSIGGSFHHWRGGIIDDQTPEPSFMVGTFTADRRLRPSALCYSSSISWRWSRSASVGCTDRATG